MFVDRVLSGMRPTGSLHLGHYHGVLKNWLKLQNEYKCLFFVADWHALTTQYDSPSSIEKNVWDMIVDWLAAGIDPSQAILFVQSKVPEHAELNLILSMITPTSWLERMPTFKDQQEKLKDKDLSTFGFLGYPLLQSSDILVYRSNIVPVGEDQVPHIEFTREIARRFNHLYGREPGFEEKALISIRNLGNKKAKIYKNLLKKFQEKGDKEALSAGRSIIEESANLSIGDKERLFGYLEGGGKLILPEPESLLTDASKMPGTDGNKMSKSYGNIISLRETPEIVEKKIKTMPTDPARIKRNDPGDPKNCPVWKFHEIYSEIDVKEWVQNGCTSGKIGCLECKSPVISSINKELKPIREKANEYMEDTSSLRTIVGEGCEKARKLAKETMKEVREVTGLDYS